MNTYEATYLSLYQKLLGSGVDRQTLDDLILTVRDIQVERIIGNLSKLIPTS